MWIKSLDTDVWINMNHITHFSIVKMNAPAEFKIHEIHEVTAFLDTSEGQFIPSKLDTEQVQASVSVYAGTEKKCKRFIKRKLRRQSISQWVGYLVAGGLGAVFAAVLTVVLTHLFLRG